MASMSTCFTITPSTYSKPSPIVSLNLSRQFHFSLRAHNHIIPTQFLRLTRQHCINAPSVVATAMARPGKISETDKLPADVRKRAMDAVDKCGRRVTVGDVASMAGMKLIEAQKALQAIAADTHGFLEVSDEGDILYVFPEDYRSKLASKSLWIKTEPYLQKAKSGAEYIIRVAFGTALIASIVIVFTAIIAILLGSSDSDSKDKKSGKKSRSRERLYDSLFSSIPSSSNMFWYCDPSYRQRQFKDEDSMGFIEPVFSFVFGDGDPNEGIEEQRWKMIGQYIGSNDGVVTAEEVAPYLDVETVARTDYDSYILPVLLRFDGQPHVDKEGNILYRFPSLQRTAASKKTHIKEMENKFRERVGGPCKFFMENKWEFSKTSKTGRAVIGGFGGLNLCGVIVLSALLRGVQVEPSPFISFVSKILPLIQLYATSFFAIPLARWCFIVKRNAEIEKRNRARELHAQALEVPDLALKQKILRARNMSKRIVIDEDRIAYRTDKDVSEQDYEKHEWDDRFERMGKPG